MMYRRPAHHAALVALTALLALPVAASRAATTHPAHAGGAACHRITWTGVAALFDRWNETLDTRDPQSVVANYAPDAVLLPAFSNSPRAGHDAIRDYYAALLQLNPHGRVVQRTIKIRCNIGIDAGVLSLKLRNTSGGESALTTRYSFVYEFRDGRWLIAHDHASVIPSGDVEPVATLAPPSPPAGDAVQAVNVAPTHLVIPLVAPNPGNDDPGAGAEGGVTAPSAPTEPADARTAPPATATRPASGQ
jgi:uncharacterized protein (TIGR02246 family)